MNNFTRKERRLILISILLTTSGLLFQNCSKKLASQAAIFPQSSFIDPTPVVPGGQQEDPAKDENNSKILKCDIPAVRYSYLSDTCLAKALERISRVGELDNFIEFTPRFPLYSDGASKRRWIYLPPGTQIDTTNLDHWVFPKGTIAFKEFAMDGKMIEIRMLEKFADGDGADFWRYSLFANRKDGAYALRIDDPDLHLQTNSLSNYMASDFSTRYNIGSANTCTKCHGRTNDMVRGFSYFQLSSRDAAVNLDFVKNKGWFTAPPNRFDDIPGNAIQQKAIGYMQSNCASCHDGTGAVGPGDFRHLSTSNSYTDEPLYATQLARQGIIVPGNAAGSRIGIRINLPRNQDQAMPKIPLFNKDSVNVTAIEEWINQLQ